MNGPNDDDQEMLRTPRVPQRTPENPSLNHINITEIGPERHGLVYCLEAMQVTVFRFSPVSWSFNRSSQLQFKIMV